MADAVSAGWVIQGRAGNHAVTGITITSFDVCLQVSAYLTGHNYPYYNFLDGNNLRLNIIVDKVNAEH